MYKTVEDIKKEIAQITGYDYEKIRCYNCANWAYNNHGIITSVGSSKCNIQKHKTDFYQFCRKFIPKISKKY